MAHVKCYFCDKKVNTKRVDISKFLQENLDKDHPISRLEICPKCIEDIKKCSNCNEYFNPKTQIEHGLVNPFDDFPMPKIDPHSTKCWSCKMVDQEIGEW